MTARRIKGHWWVDFRFTHPDGRTERVRKRSPVDTKKGAEQFERERRAEMLQPQQAAREEVPTLAAFSVEFVENYAMVHNKPSEVEAKRSVLRTWLLPAFGKRKLDEIKLRDVETLKAKMLKEGKSAKRVNNTLTVLSRMLKYAEELEVIESVPRVRFVPVPAADFDFLDFDEYRRLVVAAEEEPLVRAAILAAGDAGLRSGEVRALKWSRLDFVSRQLTVAETFWRTKLGTPKGGRIGKVPMTEALTKALKAQRRPGFEFVFTDANGEPWTRDWADAALRRQCRRAGLREISWHKLRHTFCSHLAMQGASPKAIMELARHTSIGVTQRYMHLNPSHRSEAIALLDQRPFGLHLGTTGVPGLKSIGDTGG